EPSGRPGVVQCDRDRMALSRHDDHVEIREVVRGAVRIVDRNDLRRTPLPRGQETLEIPLARGVRIHAAPRLAGEPVRRQANQHAFGPAFERGAQERIVALVQDVERPPEDDLHRRTFRSPRYKRAHGGGRPAWIASKTEYTATT